MAPPGPGEPAAGLVAPAGAGFAGAPLAPLFAVRGALRLWGGSRFRLRGRGRWARLGRRLLPLRLRAAALLGLVLLAEGGRREPEQHSGETETREKTGHHDANQIGRERPRWALSLNRGSTRGAGDSGARSVRGGRITPAHPSRPPP